jgi:hypothetical protein
LRAYVRYKAVKNELKTVLNMVPKQLVNSTVPVPDGSRLLRLRRESACKTKSSGISGQVGANLDLKLGHFEEIAGALAQVGPRMES